MHVADKPPGGPRRQQTVRQVLLGALLLTASLKCAYAYIDPNSAGQFYQLLFPLFVAIASAISALRRGIRQFLGRIIRTCLTVLRRPGSEDNREANS